MIAMWNDEYIVSVGDYGKAPYRCKCGQKFYNLQSYLIHIRFCRYAREMPWVRWQSLRCSQ